MNKYYKHFSSAVVAENAGKTVHLCGWVMRSRDHGGVIFMDLRDTQGVCQLVFNPEQKALFAMAEKCRSEYVVSVQGKVELRPEGTVNTLLATGQHEVIVEQLEVLNTCLPLPFSVSDADANVSEEVRLKYRYLDLRRDQMQVLTKRASIVQCLRQALLKHTFTEVETPVLTKATPEGAREYLVPSRVQPGSAFALQQSPQQFKQMLMVAGCWRYFQVVKCFRDEDLRADRQPEFTQLDLEMAFSDSKEVMALVEDAVLSVFKEVIGVELGPIECMPYSDAMAYYGSDKPDLRNPLRFTPLDTLAAECGFAVFEAPAAQESGRVVGLNLPNGCSLTRKQIDDYTRLMHENGAKGLAYIKIEAIEKGVSGLKSPLLKFLKEEKLWAILKACGSKNGDCLFFGAGDSHTVNHSMGVLRDILAKDLDLLTKDWAPLWVVDFPMFEPDEGQSRSSESATWHAVHHPFTMPDIDPQKPLADQYKTCGSKAYDLVLNGCEIGGGSERIHDYALQMQVLEVLGLSEQRAHEKLGHLLQALRYGAPPHAGFALGVDRFVMLLLQKDSIREVIAFPKTQNAACPLTHAPGAVGKKELSALCLKSTKLDEPLVGV